MIRQEKTTDQRSSGIEVMTTDKVALVSVVGLIDEHFAGFGSFAPVVKSVAINAAGMTRITSFGVRQWLKAMDALPKSITALYLLNCPTFMVDQLNMVTNFGGAARVLTVMAPYACPACGVESNEVIDVVADWAMLAKGAAPEKECSRCGGKLELDEAADSYFSFVNKYAASSVEPAAAQMLASVGLYTTIVEPRIEKPVRIIKLVRGSVTYFRIIGSIGSTFRARPFLVGAEGEVVLDLTEVERFEASGQREWRRLIKSLSSQVTAITLADIGEPLLAQAAETLTLARNVVAWSVLVPYRCVDCGRTSRRSQLLRDAEWPLQPADEICPTCGGTTRAEFAVELSSALQRVRTETPEASEKLLQQRDEVLSRELTDANVAQAGGSASASLSPGETILGKYEVVRPLSAGGMADVFLARQIGIGGFEKPVALKRIQRQLLESRHMAIDMFLNEAKIAGRLMHPNIVRVIDVGEVGGALFLAMEYVRGKDLRELVKLLRANRVGMPLGIACYIVSEIARALHHAYWSTDISGKQLLVVHRDVSPHNVILSYDGVVKLLDFGVAMSSVTEQVESMIVGKWPYMSPEHTTSQRVDHRSDLFSLGVILYLLCTGAMPFADHDAREIVRKIRAGQYKPVRERNPAVPIELEQLVARLLAPNPKDRPQKGQDVVAILSEIVGAHHLESSASDLASYLAETLADDPDGPHRVFELMRTEGTDLESRDTNRLAIGSGPTQPQEGRRIRTTGSNSAGLSPGSNPLSANSLRASDASVSLARRATSAPVIPQFPRNRRWGVLLLVMLVAASATAAYLIVKPML